MKRKSKEVSPIDEIENQNKGKAKNNKKRVLNEIADNQNLSIGSKRYMKMFS